MTSLFGSVQAETVESSQTYQATGVIINEDGYLLTNAYVLVLVNETNYQDLIYKSYNIELKYADSDVIFYAEVIDYDTILDLALLKMDISNIQNPQYVTFYDLTNPESEEFNTENCVKLYY